MLFELLLWALNVALRFYEKRSPPLRTLMRERDLLAQIRLKDGSRGRWYRFSNGVLTSARGVVSEPDVLIQFKSAGLGVRLLVQLGSGMFHFAYPVLKYFIEPMALINAAKNFAFEVKGDDVLATHFIDVLNVMLTHHWQCGTAMRDGTTRYTNNTNGGPLFVYVRDGRIVRMTPMAFDADDPEPWTISARGHSFSPPHRATASPHALASKSVVYSSARLLHPMKRVDFDPKGARNPQNRGKSG